MEKTRAVAFCVLAGSLFLPESVAIDLPTIPPLQKEYVTYLSVLMGLWFFQHRSFIQAKPFGGPERLLLLLFVGNIGTMMMNLQPLFDEGKLEDALGPYWLMAATMDDFLMFLVPFFVGRMMFDTFADVIVFLKYLTAAGAIYFILIVIEVVMAIPFHVWQLSDLIYGVAQRPMWRWGVIQPLVFMDNGLSIASFMALAAVASTAIVRIRQGSSIWTGRRAQLANLTGLLMSRNIAGNIYGWSMTILIALFKPKFVARACFLIVVFVSFYPFMRIVDVFPNEMMVEFATTIDAERARSFEGRFDEEDHVLKYIDDRIFFGWGGVVRIPGAETFGRGGETGLDSFFVIRLGSRGIVGFLVCTILFFYPTLLAWRRVKRLTNPTHIIVVAALMAMVAIRMSDLLINGWWNALPMFLAGALLGAARAQETPDIVTSPESVPHPRS